MRTRGFLGAWAVTCGLLSCAAPRAGGPQAPPDLGAATPDVQDESVPEGRLDPKVRPLGYTLRMELDPRSEIVRATTSIDVNIDRPHRSFFLHAKDLKFLSAKTAEGLALATEVIADRSLVRVSFPSARGPSKVTVIFETEAPVRKDLAGLHRVESGGELAIFSQFEAIDARSAFPCFDEPSFKAPFDVSVVAPRELTVISNMSERSSLPMGDKQKLVSFNVSPPLPTYLVAFAVGPFETVSAVIPPSARRSRPIPLRGISMPKKSAELAFAISETGALVAAFEDYFDVAYPFEKLDLLAVPDFGAGAMENAGAITFREQLLLWDPKNGSESQKLLIVDVLSHELAHQWFGNFVTMAWWDDLWLNEAFATWLGQRMTHRAHPEWRVDLAAAIDVHSAKDTDSLLSARSIRQPILAEGDIENAFDDLTYSKGAGLLSMFEGYVGPAEFQAGVRRYLQDRPFGTATTDDFMAAALGPTRPELAQSFKQFLDHPGVPEITVRPDCELGLRRYLPLGSPAKPEVSAAFPLCVSAGPSADKECLMVGPKSAIKAPSAGKACEATLPNVGGEFYLRFRLDKATLGALLSRWPTMIAPEKLAFVDSMRSSFRAGSLGLPDLLRGYAVVAKDPERVVRTFIIDDLAWMGRELEFDAKGRRAFEAEVRAMFPGSIDWAKPRPTAEARLQEERLAYVIAVVAKDPSERAAALKAAKRLLDLSEKTPAEAGPKPPARKVDLSAVPGDLLEIVLTVGIEDGGAPVFDAALDALRATDSPPLRYQILKALAKTPDENLARRARALLSDPIVPTMNRGRYLVALFEQPKTRDAAAAWLKANFKAVLAELPEGSYDAAPRLVGSFCDAAFEPEARAIFEPHLAKMGGAQRTFDNAVEALRICSAIRKHHASKGGQTPTPAPVRASIK